MPWHDFSHSDRARYFQCKGPTDDLTEYYHVLLESHMACCYSSVSTGIQILQVIETGLLFTRQKEDFRQSYLHQKPDSACFDF